MSDFNHDPDIQIGTVFEISGTTIKVSLKRSIALATVARAADIPIRTAQRWLARYQAFRLEGC